jgi:hypothetical protein
MKFKYSKLFDYFNILRAGFCKNRTIKKIENGTVDFHFDIRVAQLLNSLPYKFFNNIIFPGVMGVQVSG